MRRALPLILVLGLASSAVYLASQGTAQTGAAATTAAALGGEKLPWPPTSDIPADSKAVYGQLPNGLKYVIYPNGEPPQRVSLRLHIAAGSLMEADNQRGLAHFLEHMVFNGTKHFTPDELIPRMQRLGISFGAHANAYTSFDETVYMLDLPNLQPDTMDLGFTVMRDFGDGALLKEEEVNKERGVILSEKTSRDSVQYRMMEKQFNELLPDSLVAKRFPIGVEEVIKNAPRERLADLYSRFYTPERMTFVIVGDVDVAKMEQRIKDTFSTMTNPANAGSNPALGSIKELKGVDAAVFTDNELTSTDVSFVSVRPAKNLPDTRATRISEMPLAVAHAIMGRRFERIAKEENAPIAAGSASRDEMFRHAEIGSIEVTAADDDWQKALPVLDQEFRRALQFGFTEAELEEAKANIRNAYQQAVRRAATRKSDALASEIAKSVNERDIFSTPEEDLKIAEEGLATLTTEKLHTAFREFWQNAGFHLILSTKSAPAETQSQLLALYEKSRATEVKPPAQRNQQSFGYTDFGPAGTVTKTTEQSDLGMTQLVLSNNVRFNWKRTDFEKGSIRLVARFGGGQLTEPADKPGLSLFTTAAVEGGGLGKHSNDDLQQILAGRTVSASFGVDEDAFTITGRTNADDLPLQLQLMAAQLTDPGWREEAVRQFRVAVPMLFQQIKHSPAGPQKEIEAWLHGGDSRFTLPDDKKLLSYTTEDSKAWLKEAFAKGYLELSVVGDFDQYQLIPAVLSTFGALPGREQNPPDLESLRNVKFPARPDSKIFSYQSKVPQGIASVLWKTKGLRKNIKETRRLNVLADILGDRLREEIREKLGASYSPNAGVDGSAALNDYGVVAAMSIGKPEDVTKLAEVTQTIGSDLSKKGASQDEFERAITPMRTEIQKSFRENSYWLGTVLSNSQRDPETLDRARDREKDYQTMSLEEVNALAKQYLVDENALRVIIQSKEKE